MAWSVHLMIVVVAYCHAKHVVVSEAMWCCTVCGIWTLLCVVLCACRCALFHQLCFYRAMHFSAKRGIAIACRLSVCLSVCLSVTLVDCDHIGWNSSKIISRLVSLGCSLFATQTWRVCSKGNTPKFGPKVTHPPVHLSVGDIRSQIAAEWLQIAQRSQWRAYRKQVVAVDTLQYVSLAWPWQWIG